MVMITDLPDMASAVYRGRKALNQTKLTGQVYIGFVVNASKIKEA